jgi:hypothetical protein
MLTVVCPPHPLPLRDGRPWVFLAGSIDMGKAEDWQARLAHELAGSRATRASWSPPSPVGIRTIGGLGRTMDISCQAQGP